MAPPTARHMTGVRVDESGFVVVDEEDGISSRLDDKAHTFVLKAAAMLNVACRTADGQGTRPYDEIRADIARKLGATRGIGSGAGESDKADRADKTDRADKADDAADTPKVRFSNDNGYEYTYANGDSYTYRADKADKADKADRADKTDRADKAGKAEPADKADDAAQLAALLSRMAGNASVSAEQVGEIVRPMIDAATSDLLEMIAEVSQPRINRIEIRDREPIDLPGRQHKDFERVLRKLNRRHVWMVGPAGTGKSRLAADCAAALGLPFAEKSCGIEMGAHELLGFRDGHGNVAETDFRRIYEHGGVFLLDEIDAASAEVLVTLNNALANGACSFPDSMVKRHPDFRCIAAANTFGNGATAQYQGRAAIDAATKNRFVMVWIGIDEDLERDMCRAINPEIADKVLPVARKYRANIDKHGLQVILSPRNVSAVVDLIDAGDSWEEAWEAALFLELDDQTARKIREGV